MLMVLAFAITFFYVIWNKIKLLAFLNFREMTIYYKGSYSMLYQTKELNETMGTLGSMSLGHFIQCAIGH